MTGFTGPTSTGLTGPAGAGGGNATVAKGYLLVQLSTDGTNNFSSITDTNFPTSIGTWYKISVTELRLVFDTSYDASSIPPNINGSIDYWNGTSWKSQMISSGSYTSTLLQTVMQWSPSAYPNQWVLYIYIGTTSLPSPGALTPNCVIYLNVFK
jgi:hypothetical protein